MAPGRAYSDAEDIWRNVSALPYSTPAIVACCELAFARLGILKLMCLRTQDLIVGRALCSLIDRFVLDEFAGADGEALYGMPLAEAALINLKSYSACSADPRQLASLLMSRLGSSRSGAAPALPMLVRYGNEVGSSLKMMRIIIC